MLTMQENGTAPLPLGAPPKGPNLSTMRELLVAKGFGSKIVQATTLESARDLLSGRTTERDYVIRFAGQGSSLERVEQPPAAGLDPSDPAALAAMLTAALTRKPGIDAAQLDALRAEWNETATALGARLETLEARKPERVRFQLGNVAPGPTLPNPRPEVALIVRRIAAGLVNVWLAGPAGSGKTTLAETVAQALGRPFCGQSFSADITAAALIGSMDAHGTWKEPAFIAAYETGGVYLLDELDAADASVLVTINAALANGKLFLPRHSDPARRIIKRHPETIIIGAANTWGFGPTAQYCGRNRIDAATLNRFALARFFVNYDRDLERSLVPADRLALVTRLWGIRDRMGTTIQRVLGTRDIAHAGCLASAGFTDEEIVEAALCDWTKEERAKVGEGTP